GRADPVAVCRRVDGGAGAGGCGHPLGRGGHERLDSGRYEQLTEVRVLELHRWLLSDGALQRHLADGAPPGEGVRVGGRYAVDGKVRSGRSLTDPVAELDI